MGEAKGRGSLEERKKQAIARSKAALIRWAHAGHEKSLSLVEKGIAPFFGRLRPDEWQSRRNAIIDSLRDITDGKSLAEAPPIRVRSDEIGWYLFLCEQALKDPLCTDVSQAQRALPFFVSIGHRMKFANRVIGLDEKINSLLTDYKASPDGLIFELLVALSYAANGWNVELLPSNPPEKSPDMVVSKGGRRLFVECKRQERSSDYSRIERDEFLQRWEQAKKILIANGQWLWLQGEFHQEIAALPGDFLSSLLASKLPLRGQEELILDNEQARVRARLINRNNVGQHLADFHVKLNSPALTFLLGGDWAPPNAAVTMLHALKTSSAVDCPVKVLGSYVDEVGFACGFTRMVDAEAAIDKKARDVTSHLARAVEQLPMNQSSVVHLATETLEGREVEFRRSQKVMRSVSQFLMAKPVQAVKYHRFQSNQSADKFFEFDETVDSFHADGADLQDIPDRVVIPIDVAMQRGKHWELD
jgi:hypothetical protein